MLRRLTHDAEEFRDNCLSKHAANPKERFCLEELVNQKKPQADSILLSGVINETSEIGFYHHMALNLYDLILWNLCEKAMEFLVVGIKEDNKAPKESS